jgi:hypothetical protein
MTARGPPASDSGTRPLWKPVRARWFSRLIAKEAEV